MSTIWTRVTCFKLNIHIHICIYIYIYIYTHTQTRVWDTCLQCRHEFETHHSARGLDAVVQPIAFGVSFFKEFLQRSHSQISIDNLVLWVSYATFRRKQSNEIEIGDWDWMTTPSAICCTTFQIPCLLSLKEKSFPPTIGSTGRSNAP